MIVERSMSFRAEGERVQSLFAEATACQPIEGAILTSAPEEPDGGGESRAIRESRIATIASHPEFSPRCATRLLRSACLLLRTMAAGNPSATRLADVCSFFFFRRGAKILTGFS